MAVANDRPSRYYLLRDGEGWRLLTSAQLREAGILPLRGIDLGRARSVEEAERRAQRWLRDNPGPAAMSLQLFEVWAPAASARAVCDAHDGETDFNTARLHGVRSRAGLRAEEVAAMMRGEQIVIEDALGAVEIGWRRIHGDDEN